MVDRYSSKLDPSRHCTLSSLVKAGRVWFSRSEGEWLGRAEDDVIISFGVVANQVEEFLSEHPTPATW